MRYKYRLWLWHYNCERMHSGLKMFGRTPAQKFAASCLEASLTLLPIVRRDDFPPSDEDFVLVT